MLQEPTDKAELAVTGWTLNEEDRCAIFIAPGTIELYCLCKYALLGPLRWAATTLKVKKDVTDCLELLQASPTLMLTGLVCYEMLCLRQNFT